MVHDIDHQEGPKYRNYDIGQMQMYRLIKSKNLSVKQIAYFYRFLKQMYDFQKEFGFICKNEFEREVYFEYSRIGEEYFDDIDVDKSNGLIVVSYSFGVPE